MNSDQEAALDLSSMSVLANKSWETIAAEQTLKEMTKYQHMCKALESDQLSLEAGRKDSEEYAFRLERETELLCHRLQELEEDTQSQKVAFQKALELSMEENRQLLQEKQVLEKELEQLERLQIIQEELHKVPANLPERVMVFKGHVEEKGEALPDMLTVQPQIWYPVPGGSALITFESPEVASRIITMGQHQVQVDECSYVHVEAEPMALLLPSSLEISLEHSPRQVLLSGLFAHSVLEEQLLDKLQIFFSKRQNMGGEVEHVEWLNGSGHVVLTFVEDGVAERLIQRGQFQVPIGKETHKVKLSRHLGGEIAELQFRSSVCAQTVLLSGIPDVLDEELMREALEIHFQKPSKGGGEVEVIAYVPVGQCAVAVFEEEGGWKEGEEA
ncbi:interferon-induced 35 kDa protein [Rhineura floridana]|uniref:interferon-induced 35 kDa protein n=1 Tax=Rhineura floridana TaxID=261503 RepID=UPI002AC85378|nr:interferon-induced 35 kDa protein [Rhineura floridana]XP_061446907.1 interferon-induced 35 kDa protein [Rhineura floridana]